MTDDVIARRTYNIDGYEVECRFFKPEDEDGNFFCRVQIDWPEGPKDKRAGGVDKVQALSLGMQLAHTDLLAARNIDGRVVEWLGEQSLGLPLASSVRDWDPENRM
jgi:hypothetical protein